MMKLLCFSIFYNFMNVILALLLLFASSNAYVVINVDPSGHGNFTTIQSAINSVPSNNINWVYINIKNGVYREQVNIPFDKPFIYLRGQSRRKTNVVWAAHNRIDQSATFITQANHTIARSITFMNSYNYPLKEDRNLLTQAPAAMIAGDQSAFYHCNFVGLQDTLWDVQGRHLFHSCTIQGLVDFIFGNGQSIYENCIVKVVEHPVQPLVGFITAQGRSSSDDESGFVFKDCTIVGTGRKIFLGRPWRPYARVIFYNTYMSDIVNPRGWSTWRSPQDGLTFVENNCRGPGSSRRMRVKWMKNLSQQQLDFFTSMSFIDNHGWLNQVAL